MSKKSIALGVEINMNLGKETQVSTAVDINEFYRLGDKPNSHEDKPSALTIDGECLEGHYVLVGDKKVERGELCVFGKVYGRGLNGEWLATEGFRVSLLALVNEVDRQVELLGYEIV